MTSRKLSPEQFRALANARGYSFAQLATAWALSSGRISQIAADPDRPIHFDYALWGLPPRGQHSAVAKRRAQVLTALKTRVKADKANKAFFDVDAHWFEVTQIGMGFTCSVDFSDEMPEGVCGTVIARSQDKLNPNITIRFDTGFIEVFPLDYLKAIDCPLWSTLKSSK
jgi:hypothetical protein